MGEISGTVTIMKLWYSVHRVSGAGVGTDCRDHQVWGKLVLAITFEGWMQCRSAEGSREWAVERTQRLK